ncbi:MAG TPA: hypothetical protein VGQ37_15110 [Vicinamibacterales bacterium]|nr:hypothetical protein [Vicinamibacterales bacterium]
MLLLSVSGCVTPPDTVLERLTESRRLAADLLVQLSKASDAANRAVMAEADDAATAAREAGQAVSVIDKDVATLRPVLQQLGYSAEGQRLDQFAGQFAEYRRLDRTILDLAVENTNLKAQRISFGPASQAADAEAAARKAFQSLKPIVAAAAQPRLADATAALDRFMTLNAELVVLSRRNSDVRSLALSLGQKRMLTAACEETLQALRDALAKRASPLPAEQERRPALDGRHSLDRALQVEQIVAQDVPNLSGNRPLEWRQQRERQPLRIEGELDAHQRPGRHRLEREYRVNAYARLVMGDRVGPVVLEGRDLHLGVIETTEYLARFSPPGAEAKLAERHHLDALDARDVFEAVLDIGEQRKNLVHGRGDVAGHLDVCHGSRPPSAGSAGACG